MPQIAEWNIKLENPRRKLRIELSSFKTLSANWKMTPKIAKRC
jgi:hypothetical protein